MALKVSAIFEASIALAPDSCTTSYVVAIVKIASGAGHDNNNKDNDKDKGEDNQGQRKDNNKK